MRAIRTPNSNFTYLGPREDIRNLPCQRIEYEDGDTVVQAVFELTPHERDAIARGANLRIGILNMEPIPPISVAVVDEHELVEVPPTNGHP
jgi:hypothetical protein